jgi:hypothetical protein
MVVCGPLSLFLGSNDTPLYLPISFLSQRLDGPAVPFMSLSRTEPSYLPAKLIHVREIRQNKAFLENTRNCEYRGLTS